MCSGAMFRWLSVGFILYSHPITVYHASFLDFLDNPARSGVFCVRDAQKQEDLAVSVIKMLDSLTPFHYVAWCVKLFLA
jgi:hypothetical protein